jgi:[acyl-carrier-protein] S-malonyltransferase
MSRRSGRESSALLVLNKERCRVDILNYLYRIMQLMTRYCFLFPGQGSQFVGMGKDLYDAYPEVQEIYDKAEAILEIPIKRLSFFGPEQELRNTNITQSAILIHSISVLECLRKNKIECELTCGHSLGEYSALYCAGVLNFESVVKLVKRRGEMMFSEGIKKPGAMAAILGLTGEDVVDLCKNITGVVVPANFNAPGQIVISGEVEAVKRACDEAAAKGASKTVMLPVSGAFHSPLLRESAAGFKEYLRSFEFHRPRFPVIPNRTGQATGDLNEIRECLEEQLINPVLWTKTIQTIKELDFSKLFEVGPNRVLSGLVKRIDRNLQTITVGTLDELKRVKDKI